MTDRRDGHFIGAESFTKGRALAKFLRLCNWEQYQHYKDRNPPWVKLYRSILQSPTYLMLDDAGKLLAFVCMVLAGDSNNMIPLDRNFIQTRGGLSKRPDIRPLVRSGFAEIIEERKQLASKLPQKPLSETETYKQETETETDAIGIDAATQKVFLDCQLAGTEARMLCHDAVKACVHCRKCSYAEAAEYLVSSYRQYEAAPIEFKKGVFKFFKEGLWKNPDTWGGAKKDPYKEFLARGAQA